MFTRAKPRGRTGLSQAERTLVTRRRLLAATIDALNELGYAGTSTNEVADRAGVSRGAMVHHFPSKNDLLVAALEHLADERAEELRAEIEKARESHAGAPAVDVLLDLLWSSFGGRLYWAMMELLLASRTDAELREKFRPLQRRIAKQAYATFAEHTGDDSEHMKAVVALSLHLMRGMAMERIHEGTDARQEALLDVWKGLVASARKSRTR